MKKSEITIIGIYDRAPEFSPQIEADMATTRYFAGGKRHYELVKKWLPPQAQWTSITAPLNLLFKTIATHPEQWIVFASGDPLFFGIGNTLKREFPEARIKFIPTFNALQLLGHKAGLNYGEFKTVSLTGRDWHEFDQSLLQGDRRLGILTDRKNTPAAIARRMLEFGYDNYRIIYGECLGGPRERVTKLTLREALTFPFCHPNCLFLEKTDDDFPQKGISEQDFETLNGRPQMITKMAVRLTSLAAMELNNKQVFWDIGACTGSISIEVRLHFPHIKVFAFEKREESRAIILKNTQTFKTPGIRLFIGNYLNIDKTGLEHPDTVFLGGYGGNMIPILDDVNRHITADGTIVFNSVSENSRVQFLNWGKKKQYETKFHQTLTVDDHNQITIIAIKKTSTL
ncbi:precorrin-6y C5,15-methyltransferase (decarboxylating) subunit CbiE [Geofilum sp. OHC36d9]|uniref:precorrin-6y C5,15-methyltransferase (decarboxylating) subunit CbiE n=1 Tax=Geofilum sp. OHC36d9 TaxID=3458413 RepID=UPI004033B4FA